MRIGILTGGGDCPGLNAVIRAVTRTAMVRYGDTVMGIKNGWKGLVSGDLEVLDLPRVSGILPRGGTILGTSRTNPLKNPELMVEIKANIKKHELEAVIATGGDDTLSVCLGLAKDGVPAVGVPKTIDNDINGTDYTFGFNTATQIVCEAIDRLHTTAESHHRIMVVEVMGRHTGWIAVMAGLAGGADAILIPEVPYDIDELCRNLGERHKSKSFSIVVIAEGARAKGQDHYTVQSDMVDEFGHVRLGGVGSVVARQIEEKTGIQTRVTMLGYIQRGGTPTAYDRILGTRFGVAAVEAVHDGCFGKMVALRGEEIKLVPLEDAVHAPKKVDMEFYRMAEVFFG
ncbi:MAG: 6-phosphofructokinase [Candidatus Eisenbacteria bacterium]|nr:6-phosphofructokinase [Candidatus Eisenbacteria bacterium]